MARFAYTVQDSKGETISGSLEANDENDAIGVLQGKGYFILSISSDKSARSSLSGKGAAVSSAGVAERDLVFFAEQLATLLNGGVPLVRALSLLGEHSSSKGLQIAVGQVTKDVASGTALYKALEKHPKAFDTLWVSLVQAGEMGGQLPKSLKQIGAYLAAQSELKAKVITALAYPGILFFISMGVLTFFIVKIVPVFSDIFKQFGVQLPPLTKAIVLISDIMVHHFAALVFVLVGSGFVWRAYTSTEAGNVTKWSLTFKVPFFGQFIMNILVERLLTTMSALIESGVSILNTITVLEGVFATNVMFQRFLRMVRNDVASGKSISGAFKKTGVLPPLVTEMMFMGEESGKLPEMLVTLSGFYREQIEQFTRRFTAIIEPIMVVGIGLIVGTIVLAVFLPIFKMSSLGAK
ncbi:MAG: type II secretion system F family protein [Elusimicrobia bacterium]|nr:type II secretion system F family protein [Elusimicrobiota bacterium]